jgi:putative ABC transport system permease protein
MLGAEGRIGSWVRLDGTPFQVVGILDRVGTQLSRDGELIDDQIWVPLTTHLSLWPDYLLNEEIIRMMIFRVRNREDIGDAKLEIRGILADRLGVAPEDDEAISIWSPIEMLNRLPTKQQTAVNVLIAATTLLIGGIGILSMMLDSVRERRPEIGIRLAVGATRRDILFQFFLETFAIVLLGGLLGVALGVGGCLFLGSEALRGGLEPGLRDLIPIPELSAAVMAVALGVMGFVGVTAGLVPAWRAAQVDPATTLRDE